MFHDENGREPRKDVTSISEKTNQKQARWRDKGRKNSYKRGEGYHRVGVEKYQENYSENCKIERTIRQRERERVRLYF